MLCGYRTDALRLPNRCFAATEPIVSGSDKEFGATVFAGSNAVDEGAFGESASAPDDTAIGADRPV